MALYFKEYGSGPPLLVLHGLLGASGNWHTLGSKVFGERFSVYAVDLPNHGRSPHQDAFNYETMASDVLDFMTEQELASAHVLGHSMGGKTAMQFALKNPDRVERLVVVDIAPKAYPPQHTTILDALSGIDPTVYTSRQQIDDALSKSIESPAVRQFLLKNLAYDSEAKQFTWQMNLDGIARSYDALRDGLTPGLAYDGPTLFVRGSESDYVLDDDVDVIREYFPQARVVTVEAGHWVHADAPDAFARVVMAFLET